MKKIVLLSICLLSTALMFANNSDGKKEDNTEIEVTTTQVQGRVVDVETGDALAGVKIKFEGSNKYYYTDLDGNFLIDGITPGNYNILVSYVSYEENTFKNITVNGSKVNLKIELDKS